MVLKKKLAVLGLAAVMTVAFMPAMAFADVAAASSPAASAAQTTSTVKDLAKGGALTSGSYKLTENLTTGITVAAGQEVTLDLNGHSIAADSGNAIVNSGTLTIKGSGTVSAPKAAIGNTPGATCILNGGSYKSSKWYPIKNLGTMSIYDGVDVSSSESSNKSSIIDNGYYGDAANDTLDTHYQESASSSASLTIYGGAFNNTAASNAVIKNDDYGTLTINGGTFTASHGEGVLNWNVATINGGTFKGDTAILNGGSTPTTGDESTLTITGGTFEATTAIADDPTPSGQNARSGKVSISGGTFKSNINAKNNGTSKIAVSGGSFNNDVSALTDGTAATATVTNDTSTTYAVGDTTIKEAAQDPENTVEITQGSIALNGANATIKNASTNTGTVTVDGETLKAGSIKQVGAAQTITNLKSEIASLKSQLAQAQAAASGAQSTANDSARQITQLKKDLADAQAQLKTAQEQAASQGSTLTAPAKVTNLKVKAGKKSAKLSWTALKDNATGYRIYRKIKGGKYAKVKTITKASTASWTNKGLKKGKTYYYKVRAYKSITSGELWGAYSNTAKAVAK